MDIITKIVSKAASWRAFAPTKLLIPTVFRTTIKKMPCPNEIAVQYHAQPRASSSTHQYVLLPSSILLQSSLAVLAFFFFFFFLVAARCQKHGFHASCQLQRSC